MTIKEVEEKTGLARSNIRFYEKEHLIVPGRNEGNRYREYSELDVENLQKIAYLRTLGISVENIRSIIKKEISLREVLEKQRVVLGEQLVHLNQARVMCERMLDTDGINYENLQIAQYVTEMSEHWKENQRTLKPDAVGFLYAWGSFITWLVITTLCLGIGVIAYGRLPEQIPVQWSEGMATSYVSKIFIFAYPLVCLVIRYFLPACLYARVSSVTDYKELILEYVTNFLCFVALSVEVFSILFVFGAVKSIVVVLAVDAAVLIGMLILGLNKLHKM